MNSGKSFVQQIKSLMVNLTSVVKGWWAQKYARLVLVVVIAGIAAGGAFLLFGSHQNAASGGSGTSGRAAGQSSAQGAGVSDAAGGIKIDGIAMPKRKVYPVGKWDMAVPYLNPFGSEKNYESVKYTANTHKAFSYVNKSNFETTRMTAGEAWQMQVKWSDKKVAPYDDLRLYTAELGGESYRSGRGEWVIHAKDKAGNDWWGLTEQYGDGYRLTVYKELQLQNGKTVHFKTADYKNKNIFFMTENPGHRYQSFKVNLGGGVLHVYGSGKFKQGQYEKDVGYNHTLFAYKTKNYALDDLPQETSVPILWDLAWNGRKDPGAISFTLDEPYAIRPVKEGEALGALKVHGTSLGSIKVEAPPGVQLFHPELNLDGVKTQDGDTLFWLPSGYWNVSVHPDSDKSNAGYLNARLIPVSSGEMTVLNIKPLVDDAYSNPSVGNASGEEKQLKIKKITQQGDQAKIDFMLLDSANPKFAATLANSQILEGGEPGKIVSLERIQTPPSVVLALDSSGSMGDSMGKVLASARAFVRGLPDNTHIQVIDFDSKYRLLNGTTKDEVLRSLSSVRAGGSTTLYDSIMEGLKLLKGKERPTLVVFTDGVDSREDHQGTGSKATKQEVEQAVQASGIPLYTIGFGPDHDKTTLKELAGMSKGTYYDAQDTTAVSHVFTSINDRLGHQYEMTYERPKKEAPSDTPVISLTTDVSPSMDMDPKSGVGNYRFDKVKDLYHDFIKELPDNSLMQLMSFSDGVNADQVYTDRKTEMLQALGNLKIGYGTNILSAAKMTYQSLKAVPSDKRVMVFLTDAALDVKPEKKAAFKSILQGIKNEGIQVLWVGLGDGKSEDEAAFKQAAEESGGKYVISEDPQVLAKAFQEVLAKAKNKPAEKLSLSLTIKDDLKKGSPVLYTANRLVDFPALQATNVETKLTPITFQTGLKAARYESAAASLLYGSDIPGQSVKIYKRIKLNAAGRNKAVQWTAREMVLMNRLRGVDAPGGESYMAVDMEMKNIRTDGEAYLIPDFTSHFFINMNDAGSYPASKATWLAEKPLAHPGDDSITVKPGDTIRGILIFLVPNDAINKASVNFYDTAYGHITLPLIGPPEKGQMAALAALPTNPTGKLSDTFNMTLTGAKDMDKIQGVDVSGENSIFKVIEANLKSNVQADLKMDPQKRFYLRMKTGKGPFLVPVNNATSLLPFGLLQPVKVGPGSTNKVRFAFQTPNVLKDAPMELYGDIRGGGMSLPVQNGKTGSSGNGQVYQGDGMTLTINAMGRMKTIVDNGGDFVVLDVTVHDKADKLATSGFRYGFKLVGNDGNPKETTVTNPSPLTDDLLLGIHSGWTVYDGTSRRGILVFQLPEAVPYYAKLSFTVLSPLFKGLKLPVTKQSYNEPDLLVKAISPPVDHRFENQLQAAIGRTVARYKALMAADLTTTGGENAKQAFGNGGKVSVPAPLPQVYGLKQLGSVKTMDDFMSLMKGLKWLPSTDDYWHYRNAPESVLTQGWGTEGDLANLAGGLLAQLGYKPSLRMVTVTDQGRKALQKMGGVDQVNEQNLPAWAYTDKDGKPKVLVVPFMKDLSELTGTVFLPGGQEDRQMTPVQSEIQVYFEVKPTGSKSAIGVADKIAGALAGDTGSSVKEVRVLDTQLPLDQLGREPVDIHAGRNKGKVTAVLENQSFKIQGGYGVDPGQFKVTGLRITVQLPRKKLVHETKLRKGEDIFGVFQTLAVNLPDMPTDAAEALQKASNRVHQAAKKPDIHSALVWYTRSILYRFVADQTQYENRIAKELDVTAGRTDKERVLMVTLRRKDRHSPLRTHIDLLQSANQLHSGSKDAVHGFNIMSGLFASHLEGAVLPGNHADYAKVWAQSPDDTKLLVSLPVNRQNDLVYMKAHSFPDSVIARAKTSNKVWIIPNKPTSILGRDRWEWLEIDPQTYETISVMDTGEHGGLADYIIESSSPSSDDYVTFMVGALVGTDTALWSVSGYSLVLTDYKQILKSAKAYTGMIAQGLGKMLSYKDLAKLELGVGPFKQTFEEAPIRDWWDKAYQDWEKVDDFTEVKSRVGVSLLGFSQGFAAGAAHYFHEAEKAAK